MRRGVANTPRPIVPPFLPPVIFPAMHNSFPYRGRIQLPVLQVETTREIEELHTRITCNVTVTPLRRHIVTIGYWPGRFRKPPRDEEQERNETRQGEIKKKKCIQLRGRSEVSLVDFNEI